MIDMLKRHEIQVLRRAGHSQIEVATLAGVSRRSVQRVDTEVAVTHIDTAREREVRAIGRPAKAETFRAFIVDVLARNRICSPSRSSDGRSCRGIPVARRRSTI